MDRLYVIVYNAISKQEESVLGNRFQRARIVCEMLVGLILLGVILIILSLIESLRLSPGLLITIAGAASYAIVYFQIGRRFKNDDNCEAALDKYGDFYSQPVSLLITMGMFPLGLGLLIFGAFISRMIRGLFS